MVVWLTLTVALLMWNAAYCALQIVRDFRSPKPARGVWGLFALGGVLSALAMALVAVGVMASGI